MAVDNFSMQQLIIDCQLLQTTDRDRGMGKYLSSLLAGLLSTIDPVSVEFVFIVNHRLPSLKTHDRELLSKFNGIILEGDFATREDHDEFHTGATVNRRKLDLLIQDHLRDSSKKSVFFIPALFSSDIYPVFPTSGTANLLLFHDAIPFLYPHQYFSDEHGSARKDYAQRFREVFKADFFVTNSQTTADDLCVYFGIDPSRIHAIYGAGAERSHLKPKPPKISKKLNNFILMPSGDDFRKNNLRAVDAFAGLDEEVDLVITSTFSEGTKQQLKKLSRKIIFAGNVSDEEYLWLMQNSRFVFFPTEYEGLGMPILEAIEQNVDVVCANIPVFVEISPTAFTYFDPRSTTSIAEALRKSLALNPERSNRGKKKEYENINKRFTWQNTAKLFMAATQAIKPALKKKRLAIFCPSPSSYSAVGKYALEVHAELSRHFTIDYFVENGLTSFQSTRPNILEYAADYFPVSAFPSKAHLYDQVLYNIGNSEFHIETILTALIHPANAIIHDTRLNGIFDYMVRNRVMDSGRREFEFMLDKRLQCKDSSCLTSLANNQKILFCHSKYASKSIKRVVTRDTKILPVHHPIGVPMVTLPREKNTVISFAGIISEDKGIGLVSKVSQFDNVSIKVFGFGVLGDSPLLQNLQSNVEVMKDLTDKEFQDTLRASDILINYRGNYHGETSRSTLEAMRYGVAVIVNSVGWYDELPDDVVVKVASEADVIGAIKDLLNNRTKRKSIGEAARKFIMNHYTYKEYAQRLAEGLKE